MSHIGYKHKQQGMTLIEVLVAAIIVAIGLLGVASMQITALQGATNADNRSRAIDFATSLSNRMRANLIGVTDNHYLGSPVCEIVAGSIPSNCAMTPKMNDTSTVDQCDPQQMARYDLHQIGCGPGIRQSLPNGQLTVTCIDSDTSDEDSCSELSPLMIKISWQGQRRVTDIQANDVNEIVMTVIPGEPYEDE
jgi:type IV pilus assembly protein PilV